MAAAGKRKLNTAFQCEEVAGICPPKKLMRDPGSSHHEEHSHSHQNVEDESRQRKPETSPPKQRRNPRGQSKKRKNVSTKLKKTDERSYNVRKNHSYHLDKETAQPNAVQSPPKRCEHSSGKRSPESSNFDETIASLHAESSRNIDEIQKLRESVEKVEKEKQELAVQLDVFQKHEQDLLWRLNIRKILQEMKNQIDIEHSKCPVCLESLDKWIGGLYALSPCGHAVCGCCVGLLKLCDQVNNCPNCRQCVNSSFRIYFG